MTHVRECTQCGEIHVPANGPCPACTSPVSWAPQVIADGSGKFVGNGLRFATKDEAETYVSDLMMRWTAVSDTRVIESNDPVTHRIEGSRLTEVKERAA